MVEKPYTGRSKVEENTEEYRKKPSKHNNKQEEAMRRAEEAGLINRDTEQNDFCSKLSEASESETGAEKEYAELEAAAREQGLDNEADAIQMISEQENTHRKFFNKLKKRQC